MIYISGSQLGVTLSPLTLREHLTMFEDIFSCYNWMEGAMGI